jgi:hypothetical protein
VHRRLHYARLSSSSWEPPPQLAFLEIGHGILAEGYILGEEVVEVVGDQRIVYTTGITQDG